MNRILTSFLVAALAPQAAWPAEDLRLERVINTVGAEVNPESAMTVMREMHSRERWFTFPKIEEAAQYLEKILDSAGMSDVRVVHPPADGVTQAGYWTMPLAWDVREARLEVIEPRAPEEFRVLAEFKKVPASLAMWSGPTPPGGVTAELIDIGDGRKGTIEKLDLTGKIAFISQRPSGIKWLLAKKGAIGAVSSFTENPDLKDAHDWVNAWGDNGWGVTKNNASLFCFTVTPRQAAWIREQFAAGTKIRLKALADTRYYEGSYPYVTALIRGTGPEEVLTLGHTAEQGAQDNATGVAAMVEAMSALNRLITAGKLPRPRRNMRLLAMGELYGSMHYITQNPEGMRNTIAAICLDTPAGFYHLAGTEYTFHLNPQVAASYVDAFTMKLAQLYMPRVKPARPVHEAPFRTGTDTFLSDPAIGVPTVWPYSSSGVHTHHNSEDTPDDVDPRSLRDLSVITAAFLYYLASADEADAPWLAELALSRGQRQVLASAQPFVDRIFSTSDTAALGRLLYDGRELLEYVAGREIQAVRSVDRLAPRFDAAPLVRRIEASRDEAIASLGRVAASRAGGRAVTPSPTASDPKLAGAERLIVRRRRPGTVTFDDLPPDQREGWPSGAWDLRLHTALFWCDGKRPLTEVVRLTRLELGPDNFDFAGYFRFLARKGYVDLLTRSD